MCNEERVDCCLAHAFAEWGNGSGAGGRGVVVTLLLLRYIGRSSSSARPSLPTRAATEGSDAVES